MRVSNIIKYIVTGLFAVVIVYLFLLAGLSSTAIDAAERSYLVYDSVLLNLLASGLLILFLFGAKTLCKKYNIPGRFKGFPKGKRLVHIILVAAFVADLAFIFCMGRSPRADQFDVCKVAFDMSQNDFSAMDTAGYLSVNTNQAGIILLLYFLGKIFGHYNYTVFQIINVLAVFLMTKCFIKIFGERDYSKTRAIGIVVLRVLFLPIVFYTTFIYGTIIGLTFALYGFRFLILFKHKRKVRYLVFTFLCIFMAITVKQNYAIFAIALGLYAAYLMIRDGRKSLHLLAALAAVVAATLLNGVALNGAYKAISGKTLGEGMSPWAFVNMGLREGSPLYDGWFDNSQSTYRAYLNSGYNTDAHERVSVEGVKESVDRFAKDPGYAVRFFAGKNASQWNNPGFQGWWINYAMPADGVVKTPEWLENLMSIQNYNDYVFPYLDRLQFIILMGVVLYLVLDRGHEDKYLFFMITFLGGFIFHTVWEAKAQYTFVFFVLLLPMAVDGYLEAVRGFGGDAVGDRPKLHQKLYQAGIFVVGMAIMFVLADNVPVLKGVFGRNEDTEYFSEYVDFHSYVRLPDGEYTLAPVEGNGVALAAVKDGEDASLGFAKSPADKTSKVLIKTNTETNEHYSTVRFVEADMCLDVPEGIGMQDGPVGVYMPDGSDAQKWSIAYIESEDAYYIIYDKVFALCSDVEGGRVYLSYFDGTDRQKWKVLEFIEGE